jgi:hypothetical protein
MLRYINFEDNDYAKYQIPDLKKCTFYNILITIPSYKTVAFSFLKFITVIPFTSTSVHGMNENNSEATGKRLNPPQRQWFIITINVHVTNLPTNEIFLKIRER